MAPVLFVLVSALGMFQVMAAPLQRREGCNTVDAEADSQLQAARISLAAIDVFTGLDNNNARTLLQAQISLIDAQNGTTAIQESLGKAPASAADPANAVTGLQAAQGFLATLVTRDNVTTTAVQKASKSIASALVSAQQVLAIGAANCTTGDFGGRR